MTHEPGRERHMIHRCEHCGTGMDGPGIYHEGHDEYWCSICVEGEVAIDWERHCHAFAQQAKDEETPKC